MKRWCVLFLLLLTGPIHASEHLSLHDAELRAIANSPRLKAADADLQSARLQVRGQWPSLLPQLSFTTDYRYVSEVPDLTIGPTSMPFGSHDTYSIGPVLSYTLWDTNGRLNLHRSLALLAEARQQDRSMTELQLIYNTRVAYAQAQLSQQEFKLVSESLEVAKIQHHDIERLVQTGAASSLDLLNSQMDVSNYELKVAQGLAEEQASTAELAALLGEPGRTEAYDLDPIDSTLSNATTAKARLSPDHPQLQSAERLAESRDFAAKSEASGYWPVIQFQAKASLDYPDGPNLQQVQQKTVSLNLNWPLWDWGHTRAAVAHDRADALAARYRREQTGIELQRDLTKALARITSLLEQRKTAQKVVQEGDRLAQLKYKSFRLGKITFSEVQSANLQLLNARIQKARVDAQVLTQYHTLLFLAGKETP